MKKLTIKKVLMFFIAVLCLAYVFFNLYLSKIQKTETETVISVKGYDSCGATGYIVKSEGIITANNTDSIYYVVQDAQSVAAGETVAYEFENEEDVAIKKKIDNLERKLASLNLLNDKTKSGANSVETIQQQINQSVTKFYDHAYNSDLIKIKSVSEDLLYFLDNKQIVTGKVDNFDTNIAQTQSEINDLQANLGGNVREIQSSFPGYFLSGNIDGYENVIAYDKVNSLRYEDIDAKMQQGYEIPENGIGKVVQKLNWYIVCKLSADQNAKIYKDKEVSVNFPLVSNDNIPAVITAVNRDDIEDNPTVVIKCNYMSDELIDLRKEEVKVNLDEYNGLRVPKSAVHVLERTRTVKDANGIEREETQTVQGVYVTYGRQAKFKEINPMYSYSDFLICDPDKENEKLFTQDTIELYDEVIVKGDDVYDGKVVK